MWYIILKFNVNTFSYIQILEVLIYLHEDIIQTYLELIKLKQFVVQ